LLAGIEVYPFAVRIQISHAPVSFALNPDQIFVIRIRHLNFAAFCVRLSTVFHRNGDTLVHLPRPASGNRSRVL
jgi:hypothetical protein